MGSIKIDNVTVEQLVGMGDGLVRNGQVSLAKSMYSVALGRAAEADKAPIRMRLGLASAPNRRTQLNLDILRDLEAAEVANPFVSDGLSTWLKILPFAEDARFLSLAERHAHLLPLANWHWNLNTALWAVREVRDVPGDLVELGVFKGHTTLFCAEYVEFQKWPKTWWLYDTFDGIPDDQLSPGWSAINKGLYKDKFSFEEVRDRFSHIENINVIKGRVPEILREVAPDSISFMHIDMNNVPAEIAALDFFFDRLSPGGIILFDDFCWESARTQFVAETAWFAERGLRVLGLPTGQGLLIKR